jgi:rod shape-determining protein MreC
VVVNGSDGAQASRLPADGGADADPAPVKVRLAAAGAGKAGFAIGGARRIAAGMAVATRDGLVGTVSAVGRDTGQVTLVSSTTARIPVRTVGAESGTVLTGGADRLAGTVPLAEPGARVVTGGSCTSWVTVGTVASPAGVIPVVTGLPETAWILPDCRLAGG